MPDSKGHEPVQRVDVGLAQYLQPAGSSFEYSMEIARLAAANLPLTNFAICSATSHMQKMSSFDAACAEAVVAGVVNTQPAARERLAALPTNPLPPRTPTR